MNIFISEKSWLVLKAIFYLRFILMCTLESFIVFFKSLIFCSAVLIYLLNSWAFTHELGEEGKEK